MASSYPQAKYLQYTLPNYRAHLQQKIDSETKELKKSETVKYLGSVYESKLDWKTHLHQLKFNCNKAVNLMRSVSSAESGAGQKALIILIYRSLMGDNGCTAYKSTSSANTLPTNCDRNTSAPSKKI